MKRSATPLHFLAAAATDTTIMSSRPYRGGRKQWGRGFSDRPYDGGRDQQIVTGDSHFRSVREANLGIRQAGGRGFNPRWQSYDQSRQLPRSPHCNANQQFRQPPPFIQNQTNQFRQSPRIDQNQAFRPRLPKPLDYRDWEYAKTAPPSDSEKFIVLSYNILADYLAINHRSKLYFHIPRRMLDWEWRKRSILFELGLWSADIMCFQEVDRFQDLEEELKLRGYCGIWKMRTGNAVDGCAIFWRTSRFKLLYEESIEFNKLGLRDNVAQICVLELTSKNCTENSSSLSTSSAGSDKVVMCNIHVLYNPRRGEIKLGQVRTLLDRAYAVSKMWNAPVVICGDFNCTPKSPLYNFISEQKLDLTGIDRDKVSGQASAEIRAPRPFNSNHNPNPNTRIDSSYNSIQAPLVVNNKLEDSLSVIQKQNDLGKSEEIILSSDNHLPDASDMSCTVQQCGSVNSGMCLKKTKETQQDVIGSCKEDTESTISVLADSFDKNLAISHTENKLSVDQPDEKIHMLSVTVTSHPEDAYPDENEMGQKSSPSLSNEGCLTEHSHADIYIENKSTDFGNHVHSVEVSSVESFRYLSSQPVVVHDNTDLSVPCHTNMSSVFTSDCEGDKKLEDASSQELNDFQLASGIIGEDQNKFLSRLHDAEDSLLLAFGQNQSKQSFLVNSQNEFPFDLNGSVLHSPSNEVLDDISLDLDSEAATVDKTMYDPSLWTPVEIATATGSIDNICLEHPLKLKSAYTEVQDCSGTRDPNGEPLVTSYNRCFFGTVDYIWFSEGLQTNRVLAPIPKHAMQWTPGFPTKKWGSDHIALASELAFTKDTTDNSIEVQ
ncbi:carbon catabolite repressor protein 4 homolog 6 isoform X2 [Jatropha curcas]|uniref:carbon catabolite repressor protein 4 homolog 6 isoform X2 n=1 Tax=Jatropha curcas TaxID=180498 RepID=UPI0005FB2D96|nr:carbon catabolite repressor protein 4 homolog 6 isoform X2 [Jatropha curcas]